MGRLDMLLNLGEEMKLLKIELLQLQQCVEKKALNLNEAKHNLNEATQNLYETKHRVSTLLGKIITLQKPLTELEMFKDLYIKQTEEMRSLKSRVQLQEQCSEIEEVEQVIPTQQIEESSFTEVDLTESLAELEMFKDLYIKQTEEIRSLKSRVQLQEQMEKQCSEIEEVQQVIPTQHIEDSSFTAQLQDLSERLAQVEMFKDLYIKQTEEMRSLKSRVQLQEQMEKQCSEIEEVQQVIPTQHIQDSSFTEVDLTESLAEIKKLKDCMRLQHLKYMEKKKKGFYIKQSKQAILIIIPGSLKSIRKTVTKALGFHGQLLKSSDSPKKTNAGRWPMAALQPSRSVGSRNHDDGLGCSSSSSKKTNMGGKAMVLQHSRSDGSDRASWKKYFELF